MTKPSPSRLAPRARIIRALTIRALTIVMICIAPAAVLAALASPAGAATTNSSPVTPGEVLAVELVNGLRAAHGLPPLAAEPSLTRNARAWARRMADAGRISHDGALASDPRPEWQKLGENVGRGEGLRSVQLAFEASPGHLANLLDPDFDAVGIAMVDDGATLWMVQRFQQTITTGTPARQGQPARVRRSPRS